MRHHRRAGLVSRLFGRREGHETGEPAMDEHDNDRRSRDLTTDIRNVERMAETLTHADASPAPSPRDGSAFKPQRFSADQGRDRQLALARAVAGREGAANTAALFAEQQRLERLGRELAELDNSRRAGSVTISLNDGAAGNADVGGSGLLRGNYPVATWSGSFPEVVVHQRDDGDHMFRIHRGASDLDGPAVLASSPARPTSAAAKFEEFAQLWARSSAQQRERAEHIGKTIAGIASDLAAEQKAHHDTERRLVAELAASAAREADLRARLDGVLQHASDLARLVRQTATQTGETS